MNKRCLALILGMDNPPGGMMKEKTDLKNKTAHSELPDNKDIIVLMEEVDKYHDGKEKTALKDDDSDFPDDDEDIIVLKEEVQVALEEKEEIIELTDEVIISPPKESTGRNVYQKDDMDQEKADMEFVVIPVEAFEAASGKSGDRVSDFFPGHMHQTAISKEIIDAAIERVIDKLYAEKIESILRETIKKVVEEDIDKLQKQILHHYEKKA